MKRIFVLITGTVFAFTGCDSKKDEEIKELRERVAKFERWKQSIEDASIEREYEAQGFRNREDYDAERIYYLSSTGLRHNRKCQYYKPTPKYQCTRLQGIACQVCGG